MEQVTKTFSAVGVTADMHLKKGMVLLSRFDALASWDGTVVLRRTKDQMTYEIIATYTDTDENGAVLEVPEDGNYSFQCTIFTAGTAAVTLSNLSSALVAVDDAGSVPIGTVEAREFGAGVVHKTVLELANVPMSVASVTTGVGVGGVTVYNFPQGRLLRLGCMADLTFVINEDDQADFTDATPEGDVGVGTLAPANADALGTDATDDDWATATAITMAAYSGGVQCPSEAVGQQDGTSTAKALVVTALIDAADIDDSTTSTVYVSGTIVIHWINLGDF